MGIGISSVHAPIFYVANASFYRVKVTTYLTDEERVRGTTAATTTDKDQEKDRFIELAIGEVQSTHGKFVDVILLSRDGPGKDRKIQSGIPVLAGRALIVTQTDSVLISVPVGSGKTERLAWVPDSDQKADYRPREFFVANATPQRVKATVFDRSCGSKVRLAFGAGSTTVDAGKVSTLHGDCVRISAGKELYRGDVTVRTSYIVVDKETVKISDQIVGPNPGKAVWKGTDGKCYEPDPKTFKKDSSMCTIL